MPVKKSLPKTSASGRQKKVDASLPFAKPPLQVQAPVATGVESGIAVGVLMICAVALLGVFGSSMMAGIAGLTASTYMNCFEQAEVKNDFDSSFPYDEFAKKFRGVEQARFIDNFTVGTIKCVNGNQTKSYVEGCYMMSDCKQTGQCPMVAVKACDPQKGDRLCSVYEQFVITTSASASTTDYGSAIWFKSGPETKSVKGSIRQDCRYGCNGGACNRGPVCTDSDIDSNTGKSDIYLKGVTTGMYKDSFMTLEDVCVGDRLTEYGCGGGYGQIEVIGLTCDNGCVNGACERYATKINIGDSIMLPGGGGVYYFGPDMKGHAFPSSGIFLSWYKDFGKVKIVSQQTLNGIVMAYDYIKVRADGHIVRFDGGNDHYFVTASGMIKQFASYLAIEKLFGNDWKKRVIDLPGTLRSDYRVQSGLIDVDSKYPDGSLLIEENSSYPYYYIQNGKKRAFNSSHAFDLNNLRLDWLMKVSSSTINAFPNGVEIQGVEAIFTKPIR